MSKTVRIIPPSARRAAIRFCRSVFARAAVERRVDWPGIDHPVSIHMVLSDTTLLMGMLALRSLEYHTRHTWKPIIHDDGSMTDENVSNFRRLFPDARIIRRAEADEVVSRELRAFPACRENRMKHNWFLKVFDTRHYAEFEHYIVIDSDIVFFRRPAFLLDWIEMKPDSCWFMEDTREKYASPRENLEQAMGFPLWRKVNSGLDLMVKAAGNFHLAEKFLDRCAASAREYQFLEQSLFAVFGSAHGKGGLLSREYEISWTNFRRRDAVCRHYVGPFKHDALFIEGATTFWLQSRGPKLVLR